MLPAHWMPQSDPTIPSFGDFEVKNGIQAPHVAARLEMEHFRHNSFTTNELSTCVTPKKTGGVTVYGYRHYSPKTGQFLGRDPNEEKGGKNLYGFVKNNSLTKIDSLGLVEWNLDFTQNLQIGGCIPVPQVPGLQLCVTGGYSVTVDGCCKDGKKKQKRSVSGEVNFFVQWTPPWIMGLQTFTWSYTKGSNIITSYDSSCPESSDAAIGGSIYIGANYYWGNAQCTYSIPSGDWSCATSAQLAKQIDAYIGGSVNINKTFVD
jgi:RHS repeat-associated protein